MNGNFGPIGENKMKSGELNIPAICVPTMSRGELLLQLMKSIDFPVEHVHILVNTTPEGPSISVETALQEITSLMEQSKLPINTLVIHHATSDDGSLTNYGVAGSWNWLANYAFAKELPSCLILNDDISFPPGTLKKYAECIEQNPQVALFVSEVEYACFLLTKEGWDTIGSFDENIYPGNYEDYDHIHRAFLTGLPIDRFRNIPIIHRRHATLDTSKWYRKVWPESQRLTLTYYQVKWGGQHPREKYKSPFNLPYVGINEWKLIPEFREMHKNERNEENRVIQSIYEGHGF